MRTPQSCTIGLFAAAKLETQTLSLPSMVAAQGPGRPPPVKGDPGYAVHVRTQQSDATAIRPPCLLRHCAVISRRCSATSLHGQDHVADYEQAVKPRHGISEAGRHPNVALTVDAQSAPLQPALNFSTFVGSEAGKAVTMLSERVRRPRSGPAGRFRDEKAIGTTCTARRCRPHRRVSPLVQSPLGK